MAVRPLSDEFTINSNGATDGASPSVSGQDGGFFLVGWQGLVTSDDNLSESFGRVFNLETPLSSDFIVNTQLLDSQTDPQVASSANGGYVVAYKSGDEKAIDVGVGTQAFGVLGAKTGGEVLSSGNHLLTGFPDIATFADGRYVVVAADEFDGRAMVHAADGAITDEFHFGFTNFPTATAVTAIDATHYAVFWNGYTHDPFGSPDPSGLFGQVFALDGTSETPFLIADESPDIGFNRSISLGVDPSARLLPDGDVVVVWARPDDPAAALGPSDVYAAIVDPGTGTVVKAPFLVNQATAGDQALPEIAVLDNGNFVVTWADSSSAGDDGSAVRARLFHEDGSAATDAFLVNQTIAGVQTTPSVASIGNDHFVITWGDSGNIEARLFDGSLVGTTGNDILVGTNGADPMDGGPGNDTYVVNNAGDTVTEIPHAGDDTVITTLSSYKLGDGIDNLTYTGTGDFTGTGNGLDNTLIGGAGNDTLIGATGDDTLDGGAGNDTMIGGRGNDIYIVRDAGDVVVENAGPAGGTNDTIQTTLDSYSLAGTNVENLSYIGSGSFNGTGSAGVDNIYGGNNDDILYGAGGADRLYGGRGDDTYHVDDAAVLIKEAKTGGTDTVNTDLSTYTLGLNVENLNYTGTDFSTPGSGAFTGIGNGGSNVLTGGTGDDHLSGLAGADTLFGGAGADTLDGGIGTDTLIGGPGNDTLIGGGGADTFLFTPDELGSGPTLATIEDFSHLAGDHIDLSELNAIDGNFASSFVFVGAGAFAGAGTLHYVANPGGGVTVEGDTNGDGIADFGIIVAHVNALAASDFIL